MGSSFGLGCARLASGYVVKMNLGAVHVSPKQSDSDRFGSIRPWASIKTDASAKQGVVIGLYGLLKCAFVQWTKARISQKLFRPQRLARTQPRLRNRLTFELVSQPRNDPGLLANNPN